MKDFPEYEDFQDYLGNKVRFKYVPLDAGNIFSLNAFEINNKDVQRIFNSYDKHDLLNCLIKIRETIKMELNIRYFQEEPGDKFSDMNFDYFRGNLDSTPNDGTCLVVDGKKMDMHDLERVLDVYQGFRVELRIIEE